MNRTSFSKNKVPKKGGKNEKQSKKAVVISMVAFFLVLSSFSFASAEEYDAMTGVESVKAIFDMRDGIPKIAAVHMKLIHDTYNELMVMKKKPVFVMVFMGSAVRLISRNLSEFSSEDQKYLKEIAETVSWMSEAGIHLEVCLAAAKCFEVDPSSIQSCIKKVGNGWISEIGYQARGYQLVPVY
jgi:intracellular sulfur oxidation DsrE/DsrF family protein